MRRFFVFFNLLIIFIIIPEMAFGLKPGKQFERQVIKFLRKEIITRADMVMYENPVTITSFVCVRSAGGIHDFYSEGAYWGPDPANPDGPYIQRDGMTNPDNFVEHRRAMIRLATQVATLTSAYRLARDQGDAAPPPEAPR